MSATERTPLAVNYNVLTEYRPGERFTNCVSAFLEKEAFVDSHGVTRRILKVSAAVISAGAKVPFTLVIFAGYSFYLLLKKLSCTEGS